MSWLSRLRNVLRSTSVSDDIEREMAFHIAERTDDLVAGGMQVEVARREARRRFGNYGTLKESTRERDVVAWMESFVADLRYALRALRAAPAFATVAVLSLGLGIGANTAIFTLLNTVMLKSLPVNHPEELVLVRRGENGPSFTNPLWEQIRDRQDVFSGVAAYSSNTFNLASGGEARPVAANWVSGDFFPMLGVRPVLGRLLSRTDDWRGCPAVAVISAAFWQREFGGAADVLGKPLSLEGIRYPIVGVVDPGFFGVEVGRQTDVYAPLCSEAVMRGAGSQLDKRSSWYLNIIGRPRPSLTIEQVNARLAALAPAIARATLPNNWPTVAVEHYLRSSLAVEPAAGGLSGLRRQYQKALWVLMAVVGLVLLIACANVANLLLARAAAREREMAVRLALGAGRKRLIRQLLTESVLLSTLGAVVGVLFATWGTRVLVGMLSTSREVVSLDLSVDLPVLAFTVAVAFTTGILFGLAPAWRAGRVDPHTAMKSHGRGVTGGRSRVALGKALVVTQVALSLVLVTAAGLLLGSWRRLDTVDPGFRPKGVLLASVNTRRAGIPDSLRPAMYRDVLERVRGIPGVESASASKVTPIGRAMWNNIIKVDGYTPKSPDDAVVWMNAVSDRYFATLGTPFIIGRDFHRRDTPTSAKVVIVTESLARRFFGTTGALGRRFRIEEGKEFGPPFEVVGVVKDTKYESLREKDPVVAYFPMSQDPSWEETISIEVRARGDISAVIPMVRSTLVGVNPRLTLGFVTLDRQLDESIRLPRTLATLSGFFGALALMLATIGLYGIMSYSVARRRNEIGVRIALGAARARIVRLVLGEVGRLVMSGVALGLLLALALTRLVVAFLYGIEASDPATLLLSALALIGVGLGAACLPALRAARLNPVEALRED